ncbi:MAG: alpha,alpha-trehalose-phosphate synthase (UDP-forming) [Gemmatimonadaceae bacterium]
MRLSLRFIVPLMLALAAIAYAVVPLVDRLTLKWFERDLDSRSSLIANTAEAPLRDLIHKGSHAELVRFFTGITRDERLYAAGYCESSSSRPIATATLPAEVGCSDLSTFTVRHELQLDRLRGPLYVSVVPIGGPDGPAGNLVLVHDMSFMAQRSEETRKYLFYFFVALGITVSLITVIIAQISWRGWVAGFHALLQGEGLWRPSDMTERPELRPIARDLRTLIREIESESRARDHDRVNWNPEALRNVLHAELRGQEVIVVSNREPYIHERTADGITVRRPASGLVTAMEPVMRACSGTWIAHGGGSADRDVVDKHDRVGVPRENPAYQLRRVWLTEEEEAGYYYGFSNEGLWPLCHIAHVRPIFRTADWEQYVKANRKFAEAVVEESKSSDPIVLVQDYHFALLPRMIRDVLPGATIITFWHIPWPNPEAFGICPWREELLDGLLGSSILGFHTQFHCNNFVDTVDRVLEARSDREMFTVSYRGQMTEVKRYPISVEYPPQPQLIATTVDECRAAVRERHNLPADQMIGIGVDRLDYTKGIEERMRAVERLFEMHPEWIGKFTFIQIAAPTRARIEEYIRYETQVRALAARINERFEGRGAPPLILAVAHHEPQQVYEYYRAADLCFVSSLHDGMNLVAKEFVSSRDDERGVLILSQFTGAARELPEAIVVNPYDTDQCAEAVHMALTMPLAEQRERVRLMRGLLQDFNVYRWAGRMLLDAARMRRRDRLVERTAVTDALPRFASGAARAAAL